MLHLRTLWKRQQRGGIEMEHWLEMGFNYEIFKPAHFVTFLNLTYILSIARVDGGEGLSTY